MMHFLSRSSTICSKTFFKKRAVVYLLDTTTAFPNYEKKYHFSIFDIKEGDNKYATEFSKVGSGNKNEKNFIQLYHELIESKKIEEDPFQKKLILILQVLENNINEFYPHVEVNSENGKENGKKKKSFFSSWFFKKEKTEERNKNENEEIEEDEDKERKEEYENGNGNVSTYMNNKNYRKEKEINLEELKNDDSFFVYSSEDAYKEERENWRFSKIRKEEDCFINSGNYYNNEKGTNMVDKINKEKKGSIKYVRGIYIYGSVGRGKTYFLNLVFNRIGISKLKIHYHNFMQEVHKCFHEEKLNNSKNPIKNVAKKINKKYKLIFIDEFQVVHISDAMVIKTLFQYLFRYGTIFLFSSNRNPLYLYHNGLNRDQFIPFIKYLFHYNYIYEIDNFCDFRVRNRSTDTTIYNVPNKTFEEIKNICTNMYSTIYKKDFNCIKNEEYINKEISVSPSKKIVIPYVLGKYSIFSFYELCSRNVSVDEYSTIAKHFHTLFIHDLKQMSEEFNGDEMRRFILLIDILYEKNIRVFFFSNFPIFQVFRNSEIISYFQMFLMKLKKKYESFNHFVESIEDSLESGCFDNDIFVKILLTLGVTKGVGEKLFHAIHYNINKDFIPIEYVREVLCFHITNYEIETEKHLKFLVHKNQKEELVSTPYLLFDENMTDTSQENIFASMRTLSRMKHMGTTSYLEQHKKLYTNDI